MLKTNSKKARENVRAYISYYYDETNYCFDSPAKNFHEIAQKILDIFHKEKYYTNEYIKANRLSEYEIFKKWCEGLPSILDTCYFYNRSAVQDLGDILEQSKSEREQYTESDAEDLLTRLIYRELIKEVYKA